MEKILSEQKTTTCTSKETSINVISFLMIGVHKNYRRFGIAKKLVEKSLLIGKALGCSAAKTEAMNFRSQKLYKSLGFQTIKTVNPKEIKDSKGSSILEYKDQTVAGMLMLKILD